VQLKPPWRQDTTLERGQHLLFQSSDGQRMLLRVLDVQEFLLQATVHALPVVMLLDWRAGQPLPVGAGAGSCPQRAAMGRAVVPRDPQRATRRRPQPDPDPSWPLAGGSFWSGVNGGLIYT
jgi:hypothetical protein